MLGGGMEYMLVAEGGALGGKGGVPDGNGGAFSGNSDVVSWDDILCLLIN